MNMVPPPELVVLWGEIKNEHGEIIYHINVMWLSRNLFCNFPYLFIELDLISLGKEKQMN
jgi:hypothetical protein